MKYELNFTTENKSEEIKEFIKKFKIKSSDSWDGCDMYISTKKRNFNLILDEIYELIKKGEKIELSCIEECPNTNWFFIREDVDSSKLREYLDYDNNNFYYTDFSINSKLIPKRSNIFYIGNGVLVSEEFRNICIKENLKGIDFIWVEDNCKTLGRQFFKPVLKNRIGDHAIYHNYHKNYNNKNKTFRGFGFDTHEEGFRIGYLDKEKIKNVYPLNILLCEKDISNKRTLYGYGPLFYKETLLNPDFDFAYDVDSSGYISMYMSKRVVNIFKSYGIRLDCGKISVLDEPLNLDNVLPKEEYFSDKEDIKEKIEKSMKDYNDFIKSKNKEKLDKNKVLKLFKKMMKLEPMDFDYGEKIDDNTKKIIEKKYGKDMADIYSISNGFLCDKDREVEFVSIEDILKYGKNFKQDIRDLDEDYFEEMEEEFQISKATQIGQGLGGAYYLLLKDGRILGIDLEGDEICGPWDNIYECIYEMLPLDRL